VGLIRQGEHHSALPVPPFLESGQFGEDPFAPAPCDAEWICSLYRSIKFLSQEVLLRNFVGVDRIRGSLINVIEIKNRLASM
jgi:hypothetical protein